jgi:uncharacterized membrane protein YqgA involved in biofilm formation
MNGTLLNIVAVALGSLVGLFVGNRLPKRMQESIITGLGLITLFVGMSNAFVTGNPIILLLATVIGVMIGELLQLDVALERLAAWLQMRLTGRTPTLDDALSSPSDHNNRERFITGFVTASLVFCIGPLTFAGSIQDGMGIPAGFQALAIKSVLDGFASMAFASSFGIGVLATCLTIFVVQGGLALFGMAVARLMDSQADANALSHNPMILEMTAVGGILLVGLSLVLLDIKKPRMANFLPALLIAPLIVMGANLLHINIYPLG